MALLRLGRYREALVSFERALRLDPENALAQNGRLQAEPLAADDAGPSDLDRRAEPRREDPLGTDLRGQLKLALERYQAAPTSVA